MIKGQVILGEFGNILIRQKSEKELEIGELLVSEKGDKKNILSSY